MRVAQPQSPIELNDTDGAPAHQSYKSVIALLCTLAVSASYIPIGGFAVLLKFTEHTDAGLKLKVCAGWIIALIPSCVSIGFFERQLDRRPIPTLPAIAMGQPRYPLLLRPIVAMWWIAHFVALVVVIEWFVKLLRIGWLPELSAMFIAICAAIGTHLYLMLAAAALLHKARPVQFVWRRRLLIDLLVVLAASQIPLPNWALQILRN